MHAPFYLYNIIFYNGALFSFEGMTCDFMEKEQESNHYL